MGCTHHYKSPLQVGSHHLARCFATDQWSVHYLSAPVTALHIARLNSTTVRSRFASSQKFHTDKLNKIHFCSPFALIAPDGRPFLRSKTVNLNWWKTAIPKMKKLLNGIRPDVIYIDNLSYSFLLNLYPDATSVFRVMDVHDAFPGWKGFGMEIARTIARQADITVYSAKKLKKYVEILGAKKSAFIPNGVDFNCFNRTISNSPIETGKTAPTVLYSGMVDCRFDFKALRYAAEALQHVHFTIVGPIDQNCVVPKLPDNVYFKGAVAHSELPDLMHSASVGFIPFDIYNRMDLISGIRPLKLFEYFAAGLPVVSAEWPELVSMNSPAKLYNDYENMVYRLRQALLHGKNKDYIHYAKENDWSNSYIKLVSLLQDMQH